ncbi:MAG TPA: FtsX-like permease family protein, partial [Thermoplasmata archaeon]|nr:FtsX-like permease family protein [Thermoplasmata archaeon]
GEMGVLRAIGMRRRELVYAYYFEGVTYAAGSALAGTVLGVAVGFVLVYLAGFILSGEGIPESAILQSFSVTTQSLVTAYVVGFLLTLVTVTVACRRASRLNIVRAIRDIPEPPPPLRTYTLLAYLGVAALAVGVLGFLRTAHGASDLSYPLIFVSLLPLGAGMIAARFVANRLAFSAVGAAILAWTGIEPLHTALLGSAHTGGIFIVFVEGILMVFGALLLFLFNAPSLAAGVRRLLGRRSESSPVVRIGLDYPTRQPTRTVVTLAIFALVVFTMVATAAFGATIQGNLDQTVANESGGYSYFGISQAPIPNLWGAIQNNSSLRPLFVAAVSVVTGSVDVSVPGFGSNPYRDRIYSPPTAATGPTSFYATNAFPFQSTWHGLSTAAAFHALATNASVAIVDSTYAPPTAGFTGGGPSNHPTLTVGTAIGLTTPGGGPSMNVTVIGILKESIVGGVWVNPATASALGYANASAYLLSVAGGISTTHAAQLAKRAFFSAGLILFDLRALLATSINTTEGFIGLLEIFVGLGLAVGIAAMGILALRAVVERRREIGMLRASGFTRAMILRAFVLEYSFVTLLGVAMGVALGLLIVYEVSIGPYAADAGIARFVVPWTTVGEIAIVAYLLVLAAIAVPSLRAARLPPAEAVRATE